MTVAAVLFPLVVGLIAGVLGSMLGLGGGTVVVPMLETLSKTFLGRELVIQEAVAASHIGVLAVAVASSATYLSGQLVRVRLAYSLSPYTVAGGLFGSVLGLVLPAKGVGTVFAVFLVYTAVEMLRGVNRAETERPEPSPWVRPAVGAGGVMSGLLGIGGGTVQVPVLNMLAGLPFRAAVATSTFMMGLTAITNAVIYGASGRLDVAIAGPVALGILLGARVGSLFAKRVPVRALKILFAVLLLYSAFTLVRKYWWV